MERMDFLRQRLLNAHLTKEKILRVQAEHEAEQGPFSSAAAASRSNDDGSAKGDEDLASRVGSSHNDNLSSIFFADTVPDVHLQLKGINALGTAEGWIIPEDFLKIDAEAVLGKGGYGQVFSGKFHESDVAIKVSLAAEPEQRLRSLVREFRHLRSLVHPNIVSFYGACILPESGDLILVLEDLSSGRNLSQLLGNSTPSSLSYEFLHTIILGICSALVYLHPELVHGDLKPNNVMVSSAGQAKLIDFGLSRLVKPRAKHWGGTTQWMAPEVLLKLNSGAPSPAIDLYSFGRLVFCIVTGLPPGFSNTRCDLAELASAGKVPPHDWPTASQCPLQAVCQSFCDQCISFNPQDRPTAVEVLRHLVPSPLKERPGLGEVLQGLRLRICQKEAESHSLESSRTKVSI